MKALLLAAGMSKRLRPLTNEIPKTLLKINGETIVDLIIQSLKRNNVKDFIIVTGHGENHLRNHIERTYPELNVVFVFNNDYNKKENIFSVFLALEHLSENDDLLIVNSDVVFSKKIIDEFFNEMDGNQLLVDYEKKLGSEEMKVIFDEQGNLKQINKKLDPLKSNGEYIGIAKIDKETISVFKQTTKEMIEQGVNDYYEQIIQIMADNGTEIKGHNIRDNLWVEVDTLQDLEYARRIVLNEFK